MVFLGVRYGICTLEDRATQPQTLQRSKYTDIRVQEWVFCGDLLYTHVERLEAGFRHFDLLVSS